MNGLNIGAEESMRRSLKSTLSIGAIAGGLLLSGCAENYQNQTGWTALGAAAGGLAAAALHASPAIIGLSVLGGGLVGNTAARAFEPRLPPTPAPQQGYNYAVRPPFECSEHVSRYSNGYGFFGGNVSRSEDCYRRYHRY